MNTNNEYPEYLKSFINTKNDFLRYSPRLKGVKDFDLVDEYSDENKIRGHLVKWCVRVHQMYFRDLIKEIQKNPHSSYETCYTRKEIEKGEIPNYFSVVMKRPDIDKELNADVFGSRVLNYYNVPVVYNRRIDKGNFKYGSDKYLVSVDFIRPNEEFISFDDFVQIGERVDIKWFDILSLISITEGMIFYLKKMLDSNGIKYSKSEINNTENYLIYSLLIRGLVLGDYDFRNGNIGVLINKKDKTFRPAPNFDLEKSFAYPVKESKLNILPTIHKEYPGVLYDFLEKTYNLVLDDGYGETPCSKLAKETIKDKNDRETFVDMIYQNAYNIFEKIREMIKETEKQPN